jgi:amidase
VVAYSLAVTTFISRLDGRGTGPRVAVKDLIDVQGVPTTAGCRAVERNAKPATRDAACLSGFRSADARIVGKANLHELAMLPFGTNPWFGSPVNPLDPTLIPGGSSSGSAVAVATGEADVALGSDSGGSIRIPAACCGVSGLKTTYGRVPLEGVWPLAPSFDTVGPIAVDVGGLVLGMQLLEPGFSPGPAPARRVGRLSTSGRPDIESAVDEALNAADLEVVPLDWGEWETGTSCFTTILFSELWDVDHQLADADPGGVGADVMQMLGMVDLFRPRLEDARRQLTEWRRSFLTLFERVELLALPTLPVFPPHLEDLEGDRISTAVELTSHTSLFNAAGVPCTAQPVRVPRSALPASLELVGPVEGEELLLSTALVIERATS